MKEIQLVAYGLGSILLPLFVLGYAYGIANDCSGLLTGTIDGSVEVNGTCLLQTDVVNGHIFLDSASDQVNLDTGTFNGGVKAKDSGTGLGFSIAVGSGTVLNGGVSARNSGPVAVGGAVNPTTINGSVRVVDGDLDISTFAGANTSINGSVMHSGSGTCTVDSSVTVTGIIKDCTIV